MTEIALIVSLVILLGALIGAPIVLVLEEVKAKRKRGG